MDDIRVVIYVQPGPEAGDSLQQCAAHCRRRNYLIVAVAHTPEAVERLWRAGRVDRIVVARPEHLRRVAYAVEVVAEAVTHRMPRQRRTGRREAGWPG